MTTGKKAPQAFAGGAERARPGGAYNRSLEEKLERFVTFVTLHNGLPRLEHGNRARLKVRVRLAPVVQFLAFSRRTNGEAATRSPDCGRVHKEGRLLEEIDTVEDCAASSICEKIVVRIRLR